MTARAQAVPIEQVVQPAGQLLAPGIIAALRDFGTPFSVLTKGSLILRDLPVLVGAARDVSVTACVSVGSVDRAVWRSVEPGTPSPVKRLEVCARLNAAGIPAAC